MRSWEKHPTGRNVHAHERERERERGRKRASEINI